MSLNMLPSAEQYLADNAAIRKAYLIRFELPEKAGGLPQYDYFTDGNFPIVWNGIQFQAGKVLSVGPIKRTTKLTSHKVSINIAGEFQEELDRALAVDSVDGNAATSSYLNKEITIWFALINEDGTLVAMDADGPTGVDPLPVFKGNITNISIKESSSSSTVTWNCADFFSDFENVNGRITSDEHHRALDSTGNPTSAVKRPEYANDLGFYHAAQAVDVLAEYQAEKTKYKTKKNWLGLATGVKEVKYWETETIDIKVNLEAKRIPVVYGVRRVAGIPIFVDTLKEDPSTVFVVYSFCEGEIEGFLDIHLDNEPIICYGNQDNEELRSCVGNKRYGDTLAVAKYDNPPISGAPEASAGSTHGEHYIYDNGASTFEFWTFHGKSDQAPAQVLVDIAATQGFLLQANFNISGEDYWGTRHKVLDTAYVVCKFKLTESNTTIPELDGIVEGRKVKVFSDPNTYVDTSTSTNPAWQMLDYATTNRFGGPVPLEDTTIQTFIDVAAVCDRIDPTYNTLPDNEVPFWRYIGWKNSDVSTNAKMIQTNPVIDTAQSVYSNIDRLTKEWSASLNMLGGKYQLLIEDQAAPIIDIGDNETITHLTLKDLTDKNKWNSIRATIEDPGYNFSQRNVTFFNSDFKTADDEVEKMGRKSYTSITNFFCARSMAERDLKASRFSREISVKLHHKYLPIFPTSALTLTYPRFNWDNATFRVDSTTLNNDGTISATLKEYKDIYEGAPGSQAPDGDSNIDPVIPVVAPPREVQFLAPGNPKVPIGAQGALNWRSSTTTNVSYYKILFTGALDFTVVQSPLAVTPDYEFTSVITGINAGDYTFSIWAVDSTGKQSRVVTVDATIGAGGGMADVQNFILQNADSRVANGWVGQDVVMTWANNQEAFLNGYLIEVLDNLDPESVLHSVNVASNGYTFTLANNKAAYATAIGGVGVYRDLYFRIKATGTSGEQSNNWVYLQ